MSFDGPTVNEVISVTKLSWDLYHNCDLSTLGAPEEFRQLVQTLASLQRVLRTLCDDVTSDQSLLDRFSHYRRMALWRCMENCRETLQQLEGMMIHYRALANDDVNIWQRIPSGTEQPAISLVQARITVYSCHLNLCMSRIETTSLLRLEQSTNSALERQSVEQNQGPSEPLPALTYTTSSASTRKVSGPPGHILRPIATSSTLAESTTPASHEPAPWLLDDLYAGPLQRSLSSATTPPRPLELGKDPTRAGVPGEPNVFEAVAEATREFSSIHLQEQAVRPIRVKPRDDAHIPSDALKAKFKQYMEIELKIRPLSTRDWLITATWWLLKSEKLMRYEKPNVLNHHGELGSWTTGAMETYVNLLKTSWILYDVVLEDEKLREFLTDDNRILFHSLQDAFCRDISEFSSLSAPHERLLRCRNANLWEILQPEEEGFAYKSRSDNARWVTVREERAGARDEKVLLRSFVDAEIGSDSSRVDCEGTPYMLLLWHKRGESEPKVTLCNQSGSLELTKDFTPDDFPRPRNPFPLPLLDQRTHTQALILRFNDIAVSIQFMNNSERDHFMCIPREYFSAVSRRKPCPMHAATESVIFEGSVEVLEVLQTPTLRPTTPPHQWESCGVRILETVGREAWRTTRRIVFNSSVDRDSSPDGLWCFEHFLPLSRVQINRDATSPSLTMKWSDCNQLELGTDGTYNKKYSCVYKAKDPNRAVRLIFRSGTDAQFFERTILQLSLEPIFAWSTSTARGLVYDVHEPEPEAKQYKAIILISQQDWTVSDLFYMYRDTDFCYKRLDLSVLLPRVFYTDYLSTHVDRLFVPPTEPPPSFSHAEKKIGNTSIRFNNEAVSQGFMNALSLTYRLRFSRRVDWLSTRAPARFGKSHTKRGPAEVQVWQNGSSVRLASRWQDSIEDKWLTMLLPPALSGMSTRDSNLAVLSSAPYLRGTMINMASLEATRPRDARRGRREGQIFISFDSVRDREEFTDAIEGLGLPQRGDTNANRNLIDY